MPAGTSKADYQSQRADYQSGRKPGKTQMDSAKVHRFPPKSSEPFRFPKLRFSNSSPRKSLIVRKDRGSARVVQFVDFTLIRFTRPRRTNLCFVSPPPRSGKLLQPTLLVPI